LRLLRWSGDHLHGGQYNVDACLSVAARLAECRKEITRQQDLFKDKFPTEEHLKKSYKKAPVVKEKKGKKEKNVEQPTAGAEKSANDPKKSETAGAPADAEADKTPPITGSIKEESINTLELAEQETLASLPLNIVIGDTLAVPLSKAQEKKKKDLASKAFSSSVEMVHLGQNAAHMEKVHNIVSQKETQYATDA
jgi:hypothetical protein